MAFQSVPETASVEMIVQHGTEVIEETFYARRSGGYTEVQLGELLTAFGTWAPTRRLSLSSDMSLVRFQARGLELENDIFASLEVVPSLGLNASPALPVNCTIALTRFSAFTGRSARGRVYLVGLAENQVVGDIVDAATISGYLTTYANLTANILTAGWTPVIVSRYANGVKRLVGVTFTQEGWRFFNNVVDSRRDRLPS